MNKTLTILACLANLGLLGFSLWLTTQHGMRGPELLILVLLFVVPILNLLVIAVCPDREEMRLARAVRKATLRLRLQQLTEGKACVCQCGKNGSPTA